MEIKFSKKYKIKQFFYNIKIFLEEFEMIV